MRIERGRLGGLEGHQKKGSLDGRKDVGLANGVNSGGRVFAVLSRVCGALLSFSA